MALHTAAGTGEPESRAHELLSEALTFDDRNMPMVPGDRLGS